MILLDKPSIDLREILKDCTSNVRNISLKTRVYEEMENFTFRIQEYDSKAKLGELTTIPVHETVSDKISKEEMTWLYERKFVPKGEPGRKYYNEILHSTRKCPICGFRPPKTLDHYLPKAKYPIYAVTPLNLLPCCRDCNSIKGDIAPVLGKETLHPYYDDVNDQKWMFAKLGAYNEYGFSFFVRKPEGWTNEKYSKVEHHFGLFELSDLYSVLASEELSSQAYTLKNLYNIGGGEAVRIQLIEYQKSAEAYSLNHWKSAMYEALVHSEWFCNDGIQHYTV
ncbi:hypothetical protein [Bacillus sp. FJAT-52991]|uniref:HNH nuclease domain-containing protein n=1 Tax=Bacillus kandeliae TaxID=3129297 RepID=A0ABZ2N2X4_9BACI